jgi:NhaP-type Na+/H+ or K+/H+ antiporter
LFIQQLIDALMTRPSAPGDDGTPEGLTPFPTEISSGWCSWSRFAGWLGLLGTTFTGRHRAAIAVFGIRGIGTFYYLAHALNHIGFDEAQSRLLWAVAGSIVLASIVLHGMTAGRVMRQID